MTDLPLILPAEDFWSRQANAQQHAFEFAAFDFTAHITANVSDVLAAARLSSGRFSRGAVALPEPLHIQIVVRHGQATPALPADLTARLVYSGTGEWITVAAGEWGHGFANLDTRTACIFLSPALAADIRLVSRYFIDHYLLNFLLSRWTMLHASCVLAPGGQRLQALVAPHNTGKSTTALHLLRAGFAFLADGMLLFREIDGRLVFGGYPVGEVKLRDDVQALFPEYGGQSIQVREQHKAIVDLRAVHPGQLAETLLEPAQIQLYFMARHAGSQTQVAPITLAAVQDALAANTLYWDEPSRLARHNAHLRALLDGAQCYRLTIGADSDHIVAVMEASK